MENKQESEETETQVNDRININTMMICNYVFALCSKPTESVVTTHNLIMIFVKILALLGGDPDSPAPSVYFIKNQWSSTEKPENN